MFLICLGKRQDNSRISVPSSLLTYYPLTIRDRSRNLLGSIKSMYNVCRLCY